MNKEILKTVSWERAIQIGIDKDYLERMGYMEILLAGDPTPPLNLVLHTEKSVI